MFCSPDAPEFVDVVSVSVFGRVVDVEPLGDGTVKVFPYDSMKSLSFPLVVRATEVIAFSKKDLNLRTNDCN